MRTFLLASPTTILALALVSDDASAFCRQNSCQDADKQLLCVMDEDCSCDEEPARCVCERDQHDCIVEGNSLFYSNTCINFAVASGQGELLGISDERFEAIVSEAFNRWATVDCGGGQPPGLSLQSAGILDVDEPFFCGRVELNISVWFLTADWIHGDTALGYTTSNYAADDAEIFDADVELNALRILDEVSSDRVEDALLSIITHEAGHFLGLAHSDDSSAVMYAAYSRRDLVTRELTQDDIDGICAVFPPEGFPDACGEPGVSEAAVDEAACEESLQPHSETGCAFDARRSPPARGWLSALGLMGLGAAWRRRRV